MSVSKASPRKFILFSAMSVLLSLFAFPLAAAPMLAARRLYGWQIFVLASIVISAVLCFVGLVPVGFIFLLLSALIAIYQESRDIGMDVASGGLIALVTATAIAIVGIVAWLKFAGIGQLDLIKTQEMTAIAKINALYPRLQIKPDLLWSQIPSVVVITMILSLMFAVLSEKRFVRWFGREPGTEPIAQKPEAVNKGSELLNFRLPEFMVWIAIVAVLGTFLDIKVAHDQMIQKVSLNFLNVVLLLYFFQGIAIVATFFRAFRVATVWRVIWYVMLVIYLFILACILGFSDYWLDYRQRILRRTAETNLK